MAESTKSVTVRVAEAIMGALVLCMSLVCWKLFAFMWACCGLFLVGGELVLVRSLICGICILYGVCAVIGLKLIYGGIFQKVR